MTIPTTGPSRPNKSLMLLEARAALDFAAMLRPLATARGARSKQQETLTIVVPGFGSGDRAMFPLRLYLKRLGFQVEGWGLGSNLAGSDLPHTLDDLSDRWGFTRREPYRGEAGVALLVDLFYERVLQRQAKFGGKISLVGWSLGGYIAREVARDLPDIVDRVVTMGAPTIGGPKYTAAAPFFEKRGQDLDWIEQEIALRESRPIYQPITAIVSKTDGVVDWHAALDHHSPNVNHVQLDVAHLGMGFNADVWSHVASALGAVT